MFGDGLNIITGETGSGKSVIMGALSVLFGGRGSAELVRPGARKAVIEGIFANINPIAEDILRTNDIDSFGDELILRREINSKGVSRCFINDTPVTVTILKEFGRRLADLHGQHEHQSLLYRENHINILDNAGDYKPLLSDFSKLKSDLDVKLAEYRKLLKRENELRQKEDFLRHQLEEIEKISPEPEEDEKLENELRIAENYETLYSGALELNGLLYNDEISAHDILTRCKEMIESLNSIDNSFSDFVEEIKTALISVDEVASFASDYSSGINFDQQRIEEVRLRLLELKGLIKKFGPIDEILRKKDEIESELLLIDNFDDDILSYKKQIELYQTDLGKIAQEISSGREKFSKKFESGIIKSLSKLGIDSAVFNVDISKKEIQPKDNSQISCAKINGKYYEINDSGIDDVTFLISANKGIQPGPLSDIASGGELSRVMLSIKQVIAQSDDIPLFVFDEIDTGISGRIAGKVAASMKELSAFHQIIAITHLPQIAAIGDKNYIVFKNETNGRAEIQFSSLNNDEKIREIAKLLSGEEVTEVSVRSAEELIKAGSA